MFNKVIFIFRRDLRIYDNLGLLYACKNSKEVIPIFIFTPEQIDDNSFKSNNAVQFMIDSLKDLNKSLNGKLGLYFGKQDEVIKKLLKKNSDIDAVVFNTDYTPYALKRDKAIAKVCKKLKKKCFGSHDYLLHKIGKFLKDDGTPYKVYTPFFKMASKFKVDKPKTNKYKHYKTLNNISASISFSDTNKFYETNKNILVEGGRTHALKILNKLDNFSNYNNKRNDLTYETTQLSAYIKFGNISIREVYHKLKSKVSNTNQLFKQLYWREFYYYIAYYFPVFGKSMKPKYDKIKWKSDNSIFKKWCEGKTGYPVVDAGMREMNETGYMHNRSRLITSNFLVKLCLISWEKGEKYFAQKLTDYDPSVNNGNWQWTSGSGADSQPYFRIMNPWTQSDKFDKNAEYIKKWVPELKDVEPKHIHNWEKFHKQYDINYPKPIIDYKSSRKKTLDTYKKYLN
jgi:deoxyribodipyrimidine photo-lyase